MQVFKGYAELGATLPKTIVTIGNFDGLHLGHRKIIGDVIARAKAEKGTSVVYTFRPHPHLALLPNDQIQLINTYAEKLDMLADLGVDVVVEEPFSREFSTISAENFFQDILIKRLSAHAIYVGYDFGFGRNREGNLDMLSRLAARDGVELHVAKPLKITLEIDGKQVEEVCSSSRVRSYIQSGSVDVAGKLLGREFFYRGLVVRGNGRGHKIGFATANVHTESKLRVKEGVYATWAITGGKVFPSVTNVGRQPTFNKDQNVPVVVETHILDFNKDIYGETLEVRMVKRLRDEVRFDGVEQLIAQIGKDVAVARKLLALT